MASLFYVHWNEAECRRHMREITSAGHHVTGHWSQELHAKIGDDIDALVVSIDRLPSHGRAVADWFWEAKRRQSKPLIFVGGEPARAAETKKKFPPATFCPRAELLRVLDSLPPARMTTPNPARKPAGSAGRKSASTRRNQTGR